MWKQIIRGSLGDKVLNIIENAVKSELAKVDTEADEK